MTAPTIIADFVAQTVTINGVTTPVTDHWEQSPDLTGALVFTGAGIVTDLMDSIPFAAPALIADSGMAQAMGSIMAAGCIVEQHYDISALVNLREDPYEYILFDYFGNTGSVGPYFGFNLVNLGASFVYRIRNGAGLLIDNIPADLSDTVAQWRFENGVLVSVTIDGGTAYTAVPGSEAWGPSNSGGDLFGFNEQAGFAAGSRTTSLITFTPLVAPSRPYPIQVALIPARVGNGGANL